VSFHYTSSTILEDVELNNLFRLFDSHVDDVCKICVNNLCDVLSFSFRRREKQCTGQVCMCVYYYTSVVGCTIYNDMKKSADND